MTLSQNLTVIVSCYLYHNGGCKEDVDEKEMVDKEVEEEEKREKMEKGE